MRKRKIIDYGQLERMTANGVSLASVCNILGISTAIYYQRKKDDAEFIAAVQRGLSQRGAITENINPTTAALVPEIEDGDDEQVDVRAAAIVQQVMKETITRTERTERQQVASTEPVDAATVGKAVVHFYNDGTLMLQLRGQVVKEVLRNMFA